MSISWLQIIIIVTCLLFFVFGVDLFKRKKISFVFFVIGIFGILCLLVFTLDIDFLNKVGLFFGVERGADLLVYISIIVLGCSYVSMFNRIIKNGQELSRLISSMAIRTGYRESKDDMKNFKNISFKDDFVFNVRVYNEATMLGETIEEVISEGFKKFVFINDGSRDDSQIILLEKKQQHPECLFVILQHEINRGGGAANKTGYSFIQQYANDLKVLWFVGFDPDGQMDVKDMKHFIDYIKKDKGTIDAYLGSRFIEGGSYQDMPKMRKLILYLSKIVTRFLYGIKVSDPHNGFRVMSIDALKKIHLTADGMHYANELNDQMKKNKFRIKEIPVNIRYTDYSLGKGQKNSNSIKLGFEMLYKKIFFN